MHLCDEHDQRNFVTVTGIFSQIEEGEYIRLLGNWTTHKVYGRQFASLKAMPPNTTKGMQKYLASRDITGIGIKTAKKIVDYFGLDTLDVLDNTPDRLREIPTIGSKKTNAIIDSWDKFKNSRQVELFLLNHDLSAKLTVEIIKHYGKNALKIVTANPYQLARDIRGIGFLSADAIALKMGVAPDSKQRIDAAILYHLERAEEDGHCFQNTQQIFSGLGEIVKIDESLLKAKFDMCLTYLAGAGIITTEDALTADSVTQQIHYLADLYWAEQGAALRLARFMEQKIHFDENDIDQFFYQQQGQTGFVALSVDQMAAVRHAVTNKVFILTGGPGVGKTTTANMIIRVLHSMGNTVALAAPTGRAAQRLFELTGHETKTIHRLLEWSPEIQGFNRTEDNPLLADAVVIDEASMLDLRLFYALVGALPQRGKLIIIGDTDQLPSVGAGNVLHDLIHSEKISYVRLSQIFRQAATSHIIQAAHQINQGIMPHLANDKESDCRFIEAENPEDIKAIIKGLIAQVLPQKRGFNPMRDIQVLTPMNRGPLGTATLNSELQEILNPAHHDSYEFKRESFVLRKGDKVIQTVNNYKLGVYNGDIGFVLMTGMEGGKIVVAFDERQVTYDSSDIFELSLAYAITIHKSQGSEFPVAIIPVTTQHYVMLQRNLIYTALTRARKLAIFVGTYKALGYAIKQVKHHERQTLLGRRINTLVN